MPGLRHARGAGGGVSAVVPRLGVLGGPLPRRALAKLEELGVADNTIVVFHSDHGFQLGEGNEWSKKTTGELAVHVPLLMRVPWKRGSLGQRTRVKAELVDLYRTLADLAGIGGEVEAGVQG